MGIGCELGHVTVVSYGVSTSLLCSLLCCRRILMLGYNVTTLIEQAYCCLLFLSRVIPCSRPDNVNLRFRVYLLNTKGKGVNSSDNLWNWVGGNIANFVRLRHCSCHNSSQIAGLIHPAEVSSDIFSGLVTAAVLEDCVREVLGNCNGGIHESEGCCEDYIITLLSILSYYPLVISSFGNIFGVGRLNAVLFLYKLPSLIMHVCPASISNGAYVNECSFNLFFLFRGGSGCCYLLSLLTCASC